MRSHYNNIGRSLILAILCLAGLPGCAIFDHSVPLLGKIENARYYYPDGRFDCPVPGSDLYFKNPVSVVDAARITSSMKAFDFKKREYVTVPAPVKIVPSKVTFSSAIPPEYQEPKKRKGSLRAGVKEHSSLSISVSGTPLPIKLGNLSRESFYTSGYTSGSIAVLLEEQRVLHGEKYGVGIIQQPYYPIYGHPFDFWRLYLESDNPAPEIHYYVLTIRGDNYYEVVFKLPSGQFLPDFVNYRDVEEVRFYFQLNPEDILHTRDRLMSYVMQCNLR